MDSVTVHGEAIPSLGLGTWRLRGETCTEAVEMALDLGYRHIDTATMYENQRAIGRAIDRSGLDPDELFVTTKVSGSDLSREAVVRSARASREQLGVETVDLLLIHWPNSRVPISETVGAMNDLQRDGVVRHIGVSNFSTSQLATAIDASETPIFTNQVEYHPFENRGELLAFCLEHGILLTAYSPLGEGRDRLLENEALRDIGARYDKTPAQVTLRWLVQQRTVAAIPKAADRDHLRENLAIFDFSLTDAEMDRVFDLQGGLTGSARTALGL